ncbi:N-acetylmuramoyl-L-alanine amidase family protein, partial [Gilliamella sp. wkB18]|uniref:N-acetylmuramoyl-L-alanine amidase family protein n=1 Tax=Gilliamella sp. wkB18 TaxID=3120260 RepID=UPI0011471845
HLLVKYESEWYADEGLSKWNEVDELFEEEKQQQKALIEAGLDELGITEPYLRDFALDVVDEAHKHVKSNWQLEKEERIKPSLWWKKVAQAQTQNSTANTEANTPKLSNLSADGKAWFIHPVAMKMFALKNSELTIVIDPGHGYTQKNTGTACKIYTYKIGNKTAEANVEELPQEVIDDTTLITSSKTEDKNRNERGLVFDVSIKLKKLLDLDGYNVILTRTERKIEGKDNEETRKARVKLANDNNADYFISIHADGTVGYTASGAHAIYSSKNQSQEVTTFSKELAEDILNYYNVVPVTKSPRKREDLQVLRSSNKTKRKVLVELGFITSPKDAKALFSNIDLIAQQLYEGLLKNIKKHY